MRMATSVTKISGVGPYTAKSLSENGYTSAEEIVSSTPALLAKVPGFGISRAKQVIAAAKDLLGTVAVEKQKNIEVKNDSKEVGSKKTKKKVKKIKKVSKKTKKKDKKATEKKKNKKEKTKRDKKKTDKKKKAGKTKKKKK